MEQHPIPRNISGFQFHLVGDMTLKQFGYLAGGVVLAYLLYRLPLPSLLTIPLAAIAALTGVAFAFVPIQERPLDRWLIAFIRSIYSPTQFFWQKNNPALAVLMHPVHFQSHVTPTNHQINHQVANDKLKAYLASVPPTLDTTISMREKAYISKTLSLFNTTTTQPQQSFQSPPEPLTTPFIPQRPEGKELEFVKGTALPNKYNKLQQENPIDKAIEKSTTEKLTQEKEQKIEREAEVVKQQLQDQAVTNEKFLSLEAKLNELLAEKERLTEELIQLKKSGSSQVSAVKPIELPQDKVSPSVKKLTAQTIKDVAGMPSMPTVPNMVMGVVRDSQEHLLPGIIVTVKDLSGMPMRAIKTNKLGQFASATPLQNGEYLIEVEDPQKRYTFDTVDIVLNGQVFMPIEIIAKGQREIMRDKLTKELFGQPAM